MRMRDEGIFDFWKSKITVKNIDKVVEIIKKA
jgi:hypothetical protein